ncbi:hypothetical protein [Clostridium sp.]|uniref:hypothetical protein n=1 Tax=Clostridium sp. TaxID=1506 RepID=UPI003217FA0E
MDDSSRNTQLANEILMELITTYKENQIRIFLATINKALVQHYAIKRDTDSEDDIDTMESYCTLEVDIPLGFYKEYGARKNYTRQEWNELIRSIMLPITIKEEGRERIINLIDEIDFDYETNNFHILFDENYFEYVLLFRESSYTVIDLGEIKQLSGKFEIGLYLAMWQFIQTGKRLFTTDSCKRYFNCRAFENKTLMKELRKAVKNINAKMGYKIELSTIINNKTITNIMLEFHIGKRKV